MKTIILYVFLFNSFFTYCQNLKVSDIDAVWSERDFIQSLEAVQNQFPNNNRESISWKVLEKSMDINNYFFLKLDTMPNQYKLTYIDYINDNLKRISKSLSKRNDDNLYYKDQINIYSTICMLESAKIKILDNIISVKDDQLNAVMSEKFTKIIMGQFDLFNENENYTNNESKEHLKNIFASKYFDVCLVSEQLFRLYKKNKHLLKEHKIEAYDDLLKDISLSHWYGCVKKNALENL